MRDVAWRVEEFVMTARPLLLYVSREICFAEDSMNKEKGGQVHQVVGD
jgi:hypothetical protein